MQEERPLRQSRRRARRLRELSDDDADCVEGFKGLCNNCKPVASFVTIQMVSHIDHMLTKTNVVLDKANLQMREIYNYIANGLTQFM